MARARLLIVAALLLLAVVAVAASSDSSASASAGQDAVAQAPVGDYETADGIPTDIEDFSDDDSTDTDAAPVGAPLPTHATDPEPDTAAGSRNDHATSGGVTPPAAPAAAAAAAAAAVALAWFVI